MLMANSISAEEGMWPILIRKPVYMPNLRHTLAQVCSCWAYKVHADVLFFFSRAMKTELAIFEPSTKGVIVRGGCIKSPLCFQSDS